MSDRAAWWKQQEFLWAQQYSIGEPSMQQSLIIVSVFSLVDCVTAILYSAMDKSFRSIPPPSTEPHVTKGGGVWQAILCSDTSVLTPPPPESLGRAARELPTSVSRSI